jgi:hypothetical protein
VKWELCVLIPTKSTQGCRHKSLQYQGVSGGGAPAANALILQDNLTLATAFETCDKMLSAREKTP